MRIPASAFFIMFAASLYFANPTKSTATELPTPVISVPEARFDFSSVPEGTEVSHQFAVQNIGNETLEISGVETTCGCTTASFTKQIPPGGAGQITVRIDTENRGGELLDKEVTVVSNDPVTPETILRVSGNVEKTYSLSQESIKFNGAAETLTKQTVLVVPENNYQFSILKAHAKKGENIDFRLAEIKNSDGPQYELTVSNLKEEPGIYFDTIFLDTDNESLPEIRIPVVGNIRK